MHATVSSRRWVCAGVILFALLLTGQSRAQDLHCFILTPPEKLLPEVKQIAILDFSVSSYYHAEDSPDAKKKKGFERVLNTVDKMSEAEKQKNMFANSGQTLAEMMISALVEEDRGVRKVGTGFLGMGSKEGRSFQKGARTDIFTVVERNKINQILQELQLGQSGVIDESKAAQVGKMLGVDAIITGDINISCQDTWTKENREDKKKGKYQVDCNQRQANTTATMRIIKIETGQVVGSTQSKAKEELKKCVGEYGNELPAPDVSVHKTLEKIAPELVNYFAPRFEHLKIDLQKVRQKEYERVAEVAKKAVEAYDLDGAYTQYAAIAKEDPYNDAVAFNLGTLHEAVGNYTLALQQYSIAVQLKSKESDYTKARDRVQKQIAFWQQLNALGIQLAPHDFTISQEKLQEAVKVRVQVKGPNSTRRAIKAAANAGSATLVMVPGEIELEFIAENGDWFAVRLLDGRTGFISKNDAKLVK